MQFEVRCFLVLPNSAPCRGMLAGFRRFAAAVGWSVDVRFPTLSQTIGMVIESIQTWHPQVLVLSQGAWQQLPKELLANRAVLGADTDLRDHGIPSILVDNAVAGEQVAHYLLDRGFRDFAGYGLMHERFAVERAGSFRATVLAAGGRYHPWPEPAGALLSENGESWARNLARWAHALPTRTGVLACCDFWGRSLTLGLDEVGVLVPEHLAVVGVDNDEDNCELARPSLSSLAVPWEKMGEELATCAARMLRGEQVPLETRIRPGGVMTRQSSDLLAIDDPDVAAALHFIRAHTDRPIQVDDVLEHVPTNRRALERRFQRHLGHSIMDEVRRQRVEQAKRLLATTQLSIDDVAEMCGYSSPKKLADAFRKHLGTTPTSYRRNQQARG